MTICPLLNLSADDIIHNIPPTLAIIIGILMFALTLPKRLFVGTLALASPAVMFALLLADIISRNMSGTPDQSGEWACSALFQIGVFGSPVLFMCLTVIIGFSKQPKHKPLLLFLSMSGLTAAVFHTVLLLRAFAKME